jgi:serine kinase of HPr protein (carbohydrate metabolism regulator)
MRGPSGSGKSDLALRLIDGGATLVADDQVELRPSQDGVTMSAPPIIAGRLEVRGIGIIELPSLATAPLRLVIDLVTPASIDRLPEPRWCRFFGRDFPLIALAPFEVSAPAKLRAALRIRMVAPDLLHAGE